MQQSPAALEISRAIKQARKYALEGNYETANTFYTGLEQEVLTYADTIADHAHALSWREVRSKLEAERCLIAEIQMELCALVNPAEAVRRDRQLARGGDERPAPAPAERAVPRPSGAGAHVGSSPVQQFGGGGGGYSGPAGLGRGQPNTSPPPSDWNCVEDYTAPIRQAVARQGRQDDGIGLGGVNEHLYGDRDRFGPAEGPSVQPRRLDSSPKMGVGMFTPKPVASKTPPSSGAGGARANSDAAARARERVKPPVPKFAKRGNDAPGSSGNPNDAANGRPKFVPRAGEEELASLIEADMYVGKLSVSFADIAGQSEAKNLLEEAVVYPILMPDYFQGIRRPWKGILMYGPPGTGKTMLAKAVASECGTTFFNISPATLTSKWRGDSEKLIRVLFDMARHYAPSTIFIDEIDSLCSQRGGGDEHEASKRAKGVLLTQMDGVGVDPGKVVMVLGATNHPWDIDEAMRRRLEKRIYIPLPTCDDRIELFRINTRTVNLASDVDFDHLSRILEDHFYSAADITTICRDAAMMTMRRFLADENTKKELRQRGAEIGKLAAEQPITMSDFISAIRKVPSSINVDQIKKFEEWKKEFEVVI